MPYPLTNLQSLLDLTIPSLALAKGRGISEDPSYHALRAEGGGDKKGIREEGRKGGREGRSDEGIEWMDAAVRGWWLGWGIARSAGLHA